jgi:hypothetical protein
VRSLHLSLKFQNSNSKKFQVISRKFLEISGTILETLHDRIGLQKCYALLASHEASARRAWAPQEHEGGWEDSCHIISTTAQLAASHHHWFKSHASDLRQQQSAFLLPKSFDNVVEISIQFLDIS